MSPRITLQIQISISSMLLLSIGCESPPSDKFEPLEHDLEELTIELPQFSPCPDGWTERSFDVGDDYVPTYCEPTLYYDDNENSQENIGTKYISDLLPCPQGWTEVTDPESGTVTCDPYSETGPEECEPGHSHFPGEPGCTGIGAACPSGDWAEDLTNYGPVIYVRAQAPEDGDGSFDSPFSTIAQAMAMEPEQGTIVALSKGVYDEQVSLLEGVTLWGACVAETVVTLSNSRTTKATIEVAGAGTHVKNLTVRGEGIGISVKGIEKSAHLENVIIDGAHVFGVLAESSSMTAQNCIIRNTRSKIGHKNSGIGLKIQGGATVEVKRSIIEQNRMRGIDVFNSQTNVILSDVVVRDTLSAEATGREGIGLAVDKSATVEANRSLFEGNRQSGILVSGGDTHVNLRDVVVRNTLSRKCDKRFGTGLQVTLGAVVEVNRALFERNRDVGIWAHQEGTTVNLTDVVVRDTLSRESDKTYGRGLYVSERAQVRVNKTLFERNRDRAICVRNDGTLLNLNSVVVRDTLSRESDKTYGIGLDVNSGATVDVSHALFERNRDVGIWVNHDGTTVSLTDVVVRDTLSRESDKTNGRGLHIQKGAVQVSHALFERNRDTAIYAIKNGTFLNLDYVVVRDTQSRESTQKFGRGLHVQEEAQVQANHVLFEKNREVSISAYAYARLKLTDVLVIETLQQECVDDDTDSDCANEGVGSGISLLGGSHLEMRRFIVGKSKFCGAQLAYGGYSDDDGNDTPFQEGGTVDFYNGIFWNNRIALNIQTEDFDVRRILGNVLFMNNGSNVLTNILHIPNSDTIQDMIYED